MTKRRWLYPVVSCVLVLLACSAMSQVNVRATVSRDKILIGEPLKVTVEAYVPLGIDFTWFRADSIPAFEITHASLADTAESIDGKKVSQTLTVTSFDSGRQYIRPFEIIVNGQPFYTDSIPVDVSFTPFDPNADYRDIKDIIAVVNPNAKYIPFAITAICILSLAGLVYLLAKRKKPDTPLAVERPALSPYDEAMSALKELGRRNPQNGEIKVFYSDLNDVLRKYLSREYKLATFERTNEELIMQLSRLDLPKDAYIRLAQSLRTSDFVKFAKYKPEASENAKSLEIVRISIDMLSKRMVSAV